MPTIDPTVDPTVDQAVDEVVDEARERGSTLPFVLVCWTVAALMAFGAIAASDAFLEQQEVQAVCDGAATAQTARARASAGRSRRRSNSR